MAISRNACPLHALPDFPESAQAKQQCLSLYAHQLPEMALVTKLLGQRGHRPWRVLYK
jgi:hypothetical protein